MTWRSVKLLSRRVTSHKPKHSWLRNHIISAEPSCQAARTLPVLRDQRQYAEPATLSSSGVGTGPEVAEPPQPAPFVQLVGLPPVSGALPSAGGPHRSQHVHAIACNVRFTEEPDVGNPQVRFCEGR